MLQKISPLIKHVSNSPTLTTFASYATRTISVLIVLPLILSRFSIEEITAWYLFATFIGMQILIDMGFSPTFTRVIAYASGGVDELSDNRSISKTSGTDTPNWMMIEKIWNTMRVVFLRLTFVAFFLLLFVGTWSLVKPLSLLQDSFSGWLSWAVIVLVTSLSVWNGSYISFLQGMNKVAIQKRSEAIISLLSIFTSFFVLLLGGRLFALVLANQVWVLINIGWNRYLCRTIEPKLFTIWKKFKIHSDVFSVVWPSAWRSGVGGVMAQGVVQATGIIYAQFGTAASVSSYLLALRFIQIVSLFSQSPFYSKLPLMAKLRAEGKIGEQITVAQRGMFLAYWIYAIGFIGIGLLVHPALKHIGSHAEFVPSNLWALIGITFFIERYGAMHIQLYSTTNRIIWHIANGISGIINIIFVFLTYSSFGVYSFPLGILVSYVSYYCWYAAMHSYREFRINVVQFESKTILLPFLSLILYSLLALAGTV
ncbi:MAG: hypothetical protein ACOYU5_04045 [Stygiobacter sp.]